MELIVISAPTYFKDEGKFINGLFYNDLNILHLRKEQSDKTLLSDLISQIEPKYYDRISLHQCHELKAVFGLGRLHYPEQLRRARKDTSLPADQLSSTSIHDLKALDELDGFAYTFFGPVFNSLSKPGYKGVVTRDFKLPERQLKVIALGGIAESNVRQVMEMGFDGLAVMGTLWNDLTKALSRFKQIQSLC